MDKGLFTQSLVKFFLGVVIVGLLLFLPAGSFKYWQGWLLMGILFVPMFIAGLVMMARNPELLRKRLNAKEEQKEQKTVVKLSGLRVVRASCLGRMGSGGSVSDLLSSLCRGSAGEYLSVQNHRSSGESESYRYRPLRRRSAPDVLGHYRIVSCDAAGAGFADIILDNVALHSTYRQAHQERGKGSGRRAGGL